MVPKLKKNKRYLFYRVYLVVVGGLWILFSFLLFDERTGADSVRFFRLIAMIPFAILATPLAISWAAFPFRYSAIGPFERSATPTNEKIIYSKNYTSGVVGRLSGTAPFFSFRLYKSGLAVSITFAGEAFVPFQMIETIEEPPLSLFLKSRRIFHSCPDIRSPIIIRGKKLSGMVEELYDANRRNN